MNLHAAVYISLQYDWTLLNVCITGKVNDLSDHLDVIIIAAVCVSFQCCSVCVCVCVSKQSETA